MHTIFGAGPVGLSTAEALRRRDQPVRLVSRHRPTTLPPGVQHLSGDVHQPDLVAAACDGAEVVYQCLNAPYHRWATDFPPLQAAVVAGARASGARLVSFENVYLYGCPADGRVQEDSPLAPCSDKGRVRAAMAAELDALHAAGALGIAHVRASDLFGPGMRGSALGDEVLGRAAAGKSPRVAGRLDVPHTWTFTRDAGETLARVGLDPALLGGTYHVPSAPPATVGEVLALAGPLLGRRLDPQPTPAWMLRLVGLFVPEAGAMVEMLYQFDRPFVVSDAATRAALGQAPTPLRDALAETLAWFGAAATGVGGRPGAGYGRRDSTDAEVPAP